MKKHIYLRAVVFLFLTSMITFLHAQTGTASGTYNFASIGPDNSGGPGFKTQQDKFHVSNIMMQDGTGMFAMNGDANTSQTIILKAEGGLINKKFTLQNMQLSNFSTSSALSTFTLTLRNSTGTQIARHTLSGIQPMSETVVALTSLNFSVPFPVAGYTDVSEIEITFRYGSATIAPDEMTFHSITIANVSNAVLLPLSLIEFRTRQEDGAIRVNWSTSKEIMSGLHVIEHSTDGVHFTKLAEFKGSNYSATTLQYTYLHTTPAPGRNYYRLKEIGLDGTEKSFPITSVNMEKGTVTVAGPNPFRGLIYVKGLEKGNMEMYLTDMAGKVVWKKERYLNAAGEQTIQLPALLPRGMYTLSIHSNNKTSPHQLVKD